MYLYAEKMIVINLYVYYLKKRSQPLCLYIICYIDREYEKLWNFD